MDHLRTFFRAPAHALDLAVFRITVCLMVLGTRDVYAAIDFSELSPSLRQAPPGLAWLPINGDLARVGVACLVVSCVAGLVGWRTRASITIAALCAFYVLAIPQFHGGVFHDHHLVWFLAVLAVSPCGDALSVDSRGKPEPVASTLYALPLRVCWLLVGIIYFFPGLWKLRASGLSWIFSDNLQHIMQGKWLQNGEVPWLRVDVVPWLCQLGAACAVMFELSFIVLVLFDVTRRAAVACAIVFHVLGQAALQIPFFLLWGCYTMFIRWRPVRSSVPAKPQTAVLVVGGVLIVGNLIAGFLGETGAWPFACYPTFQRIAAARLPAVEVEALVDGEWSSLDKGMLAEKITVQRVWALQWSILAEQDVSRRQGLMRGYAESLRGTLSGVSAVRFKRVMLDVAPERWNSPAQASLIWEWNLSSSP